MFKGIWLADLFENFRNMYLEIYELDLAKFLSASGLAWQVALKKKQVKLDLLNDIDMSFLLMVEKGIRGGICHSIFAKANNKYTKDYNKKKESSNLQYWNVNSLYALSNVAKVSRK